MNFHWMEVYLSVLDTGSFAAAARREYMTQPAVSMAISSLEKEMNQTLLYRHAGQRGRIQPTPEGRVFAEFARKTLAEYGRMKDSFAIGPDEKPLIIGSSPTPASSILPGLMSSYRASRPQCQVQVKAFRGKELRNGLRNGEYDCVVTGIESMTQSDDLREEVFFQDPMVLICSSTFRDASPITLKQLRKLPLIIRHLDCFTMELLVRELAKNKVRLEDMNVVLEVYGNLDVLNQVSMGYGVGFVVRSSLDGRRDFDKFNIIPVRGLKLAREIRIVYQAEKENLQTLRSFVQFARGTEWREGKFSFNTIPGAAYPGN